MNTLIYVHNRVNTKLSKPQFNPLDNESKYKNVNLVSYVNQYHRIMTQRKYNRDLMHGWRMKRCIAQFVSYMTNNKNLFNIK